MTSLDLGLTIFLISFGFYFVLRAILAVRAFVNVDRNVDLEKNILQFQIQQLMEVRKFETEKRELSWNGYRKFSVSKKVEEGLHVCSFYLSPHDGKRLPPFLPGQYLTFEIHIPLQSNGGVMLQGQRRSVIRCYSLSDGPNHPDYYRITIKKIFPPPDSPSSRGGLVSSYFHDEVKVGDILNAKAPMGKFCLDVSKQTPVVLVGGGIGVTPMLSMLNAIVEARSQRETWFFYGVRNKKDHIMKEPIERISREFRNVHFHVCYSNPGVEDQEGKDYHHFGHASVDLMKKVLPSNNFQFYLCGPPPMMTQMTQELKEWGVPKLRIFFEAFGPATVKKLAGSAPLLPKKDTEQSFQVTFAKSQKTTRWNKVSGTLLELAEANGIPIDSGCRAGNCGTCMIAIRSGQVDSVVKHDAKSEKGSCLTCVSIPQSDVTLDV
jgi:uncharacterized protein